jgi:hypothetical protein
VVKPRISTKEGGNYNGNGIPGKTGKLKGSFTNDPPNVQKTVGNPPVSVV